MSEYYGVSTPTDDFLAHYGVKGMKWGVRKAIDKGSDRALDRQYRKAQKKLQKLRSNADVDRQLRLHNQHKANAIGYGIGTALYPVAGHAMTQLSKQGMLNAMARKAEKLKNIPGLHIIGGSYDDYRPWGYIAGGASLGASVASGIAAHKARKRTTKVGHEKAIRELNTWQKEMNSAFKGTKYGKKKR